MMTTTVLLLTTYGYAFLFPLSIFEGPILTVIGGFLSTMGIMNAFAVYLVVVAGDVVGDLIFYIVGRTGGVWFHQVSSFFRITPEKIEQATRFFNTHSKKALVFSKVFHGVGVAGLLAAGMLKVRYKQYLLVCGAVSIVQSAILLLLGVFFGHLYVQISRYLDFFAASMSVLAVALIVVFILYKTKGLSILGK